MAARTQDSGKLGDRRPDIRKVSQRQSTHDDVYMVVGQGEIAQVALPQFRVRNADTNVSEHVRGTVDADDVVALLGQVPGVPAGAASRVQGHAQRQSAEDLVHDGFFDSEQPITWLIIGRGPHFVAVQGVDLRRGDSGTVQCRAVQKAPDLADPRFDEVLVVVAGEGTQQRHALEPQGVSERMLVGHHATVATTCGSDYPIPAWLSPALVYADT